MNNSLSNDEFWESQYLQLVDYLVKDIKLLELEAIRLRYELSKHLSNYDELLLKSDIYSGLADRYEWQEAYARYVTLYCGGKDPLDE